MFFSIIYLGDRMIDTHAHINPRDINNVDELVKEINELEYLNFVINVGLDYDTSKYAIELANREEKFYSVIGVHPLYEGSLESILNLYETSDTSKVVGIGETGLDDSWELKSQERKFHESIDLANTLELPLVIHANNTNSKCLRIIKSHKPKFGFVFHCFQPNLDALDEIMRMGGFISVGTPITRPTAKKSLEVIRKVDINQLLIELDCPYMSNDPFTDGRNVFNRVKDLRGFNHQELELILDNNAKRLFRKMK